MFRHKKIICIVSEDGTIEECYDADGKEVPISEVVRKPSKYVITIRRR